MFTSRFVLCSLIRSWRKICLTSTFILGGALLTRESDEPFSKFCLPLRIWISFSRPDDIIQDGLGSCASNKAFEVLTISVRQLYISRDSLPLWSGTIFHTKLWTLILQNMHFTDFYFCVWFTISLNYNVICLSETFPRIPLIGITRLMSCYENCILTYNTLIKILVTSDVFVFINSQH